jgi:hypothetical protein
MDSKTQLWLEVAKLIVTLIAAGVAAFVAWRIGSSQRDIAKEQKRISAAKLNLDLFEERYELFNKVWTYLSRIKTDGPQGATPPDIGNIIPKARFLFGEPIANWMRDAYLQHVDLGTLDIKIRQGSTSDEDKARLVKLETWFEQEAKSCFERFSGYLDFSHWKAPTS